MQREHLPCLCVISFLWLPSCSRYTKADNSVVIATDSIKNTVYILAKQHQVTPPELFASIVACHFVHTYGHIDSATVDVITHKWTRIVVNGEPHPHSFVRDGSEARNAQVKAIRSFGISVRSGITELRLLKSTGSEFHGFIRDEYTTLPEVSDRILSTEVDCSWDWATFSDLTQVESSVDDFDAAWNAVRTITLNTFAVEQSASVQNTIYKMCEQVFDVVPGAEKVEYVLPNKHYFEIGMSSEVPLLLKGDLYADVMIDLSWHKGLQNTGKNAEVYAPQSDPNGLIKYSITRSRDAS